MTESATTLFECVYPGIVARKALHPFAISFVFVYKAMWISLIYKTI